MSDFEISDRKSAVIESHDDSWWLSLFLPRCIKHEFERIESVGFDEHQPMLLGETLIASDGAILAWCPLDDECPWTTRKLGRNTHRANNIRAVASLAMQAGKAVYDYDPAFTFLTAIHNSGDVVNLDGIKFASERLQLISQLPNSEIGFGETIVNRESHPGLFFRWGHHGGGFLLPMAD